MTAIRSATGEQLLKSYEASGMTQEAYATVHNLDPVLFHSRISNARERRKKFAGRIIPESPYPIYDQPLSYEGDALVLPDVEAPYHHAEFLNRVLELAGRWGITHAVLAGDAVHFNLLSSWEPNWKAASKPGGLSEEQEKELLAKVAALPAQYQEHLKQAVMAIGRPEGDDNDEIAHAKRVLKAIGSAFKSVDYVLGNHEGRFLAALNSPVMVRDFADYLGLAPSWRISPFYYSWVVSAGERFRIIHPKGAGKATAVQIAAKYQASVLMAHSHRLCMDWDQSGSYYAYQIGCCVDERRLPYCAQRDTAAAMHKLGAVIVRDGYPWVLHDRSDWERLKRA